MADIYHLGKNPPTVYKAKILKVDKAFKWYTESPTRYKDDTSL